ncbi:hypothetical protein BRADI_5g12670v3 [Brachypodium distachyon]|uniref:F-box domain-containing protein n=2 Tax=Brachypodium distachyon TaxID=15368 RepID=A0A2K2CGS9_BRADI|nr:hypothetical protein BRADI_5g12670v3 [Brachypodium distachyon]
MQTEAAAASPTVSLKRDRGDASTGNTAASPIVSVRKRPRVDVGTGTGTDRLGDLPDCLLHEILAYLGSRQAVQTCALSRRWRDVWRSVPCVDIDQREFPAGGVSSAASSSGFRLDRERFEDFADTILSSLLPPGEAPPPPLGAFRLHLQPQVDRFTMRTHFERWIRRALRRHPAAVDLHCIRDSAIEWPLPSTSDLDLGSGTGTFSRLRSLRLYEVWLRDACFGQHLGVQCPVLEDLRIERCVYWVCRIASPTLKTLAIIRSRSHYRGASSAIAAPRLAFLELVLIFSSTPGSPVMVAPENDALASLVKASICIEDADDLVVRAAANRRPNKHKQEFLKSMCSFLSRLTNVRTLALSGFTTTALLDQESQDFPAFKNLETLLLDGCDIGVENFQVLTRILANTPNLETLGLYQCKFLGRARKKKGKAEANRKSSKQREPSLLAQKNLKSIEIKYVPNDCDHFIKAFKTIRDGMPGKLQSWRLLRNRDTENQRLLRLVRKE